MKIHFTNPSFPVVVITAFYSSINKMLTALRFLFMSVDRETCEKIGRGGGEGGVGSNASSN